MLFIKNRLLKTIVKGLFTKNITYNLDINTFNVTCKAKSDIMAYKKHKMLFILIFLHFKTVLEPVPIVFE